ncbi:hypothetical protein [Mammaliicoccus sciuri]|uniref:hypothetical protein n=1 Tax=Mammaliicoccus sciuri TaxID=1296 RepID=UPI000D1F4433|nr:hypothetical protein [Mammaliicoccus sciuri]MEB5759192.1 hypothetical protein [Mammaliicoccus sciuri]PTJ63582.1 hypothetical protein BUZ97_07385 [Mammaliicoccus sciuri]QQC96276.1 hypothetical protein JCQ35_04395 [Mammaliicoccus sciuri]RIN90611.1 hypothetical protein BU011_01265 [Mammaliicoccus sciuri]RIN91122.1 hypothetical protein BU003_06695 [Mammaliicoccus sciuri]
MTVDWSILSNPIVASIVGGSVGWSLSQFTNRKRMKHEKEINDMKLKADVVVKSRMEWIKEVRELSSDLVAEHTNQLLNIKKLISLSNEFNVEELRKTWQENINKEYLNKSPQDYLLQINEIGEEFNDDIKETSNELDEFIKIITFYLKQEWEKVKRIE